MSYYKYPDPDSDIERPEAVTARKNQELGVDSTMTESVEPRIGQTDQLLSAAQVSYKDATSTAAFSYLRQRFPLFTPGTKIVASQDSQSIAFGVGRDKLLDIKWYTQEQNVNAQPAIRPEHTDGKAKRHIASSLSTWIQRPDMIPAGEHEVGRSQQYTAAIQKDQKAGRPTLHRLISDRVPPSSPPEAIQRDSLSMPTLPTFHQNSQQELIDEYRVERAGNPAGFDQRTKEIKDSLVAAKVARGGSHILLANEYTAELASRMDAEMVSEWEKLVPRQLHLHDHDHDHQPDEQETDTEIEAEEGSTFPSARTPTTDLITNLRVSYVPVSSDERPHSPTAPTKMKKIYILPLGFRLSDHVQKTDSSGSIAYKTHTATETRTNGNTKTTTTTWIEIKEEHILHGENQLSFLDVASAMGEKLPGFKSVEEGQKSEGASASAGEQEGEEEGEEEGEGDKFTDTLIETFDRLAVATGFDGDGAGEGDGEGEGKGGPGLDPELTSLMTRMSARLRELKNQGKLKYTVN